MEARPTALWWAALGVSSSMLLLGVVAVTYEISVGVGTWGLNRTVGWAFDITNFVFWIGIGHAGTLISAILFLFRQRWRTSVNRSAEAMTIFAVMCAGIFPVIHMGRPWFAYWMFPYPNTRGPLWINFRSPLVWDFFAISTYFTVSALFWYVGMLPDLATIRDRATAKLAPQAGRCAEPGLERFLPGVAALRSRVLAAGGSRHAAGHLGAHHRELGFRHGGASGLACHHFPAVLRGGRNLLRHGDGAHVDDHCPQG